MTKTYYYAVGTVALCYEHGAVKASSFEEASQLARKQLSKGTLKSMDENEECTMVTSDWYYPCTCHDSTD